MNKIFEFKGIDNRPAYKEYGETKYDYESEKMWLWIYMHEEGLVEGDDSPGNVLISFKERNGKGFANTIPHASGQIQKADGSGVPPMAANWTERHELNDLKAMGGKWEELYYALVEADEIVRSMNPSFCVIQREEDIRRREEKLRAYQDEAIEAFLAAKGLTEEHKFKSTEEAEQCAREYEDFKKEWTKAHPHP